MDEKAEKAREAIRGLIGELENAIPGMNDLVRELKGSLDAEGWADPSGQILFVLSRINHYGLLSSNLLARMEYCATVLDRIGRDPKAGPDRWN